MHPVGYTHRWQVFGLAGDRYQGAPGLLAVASRVPENTQCCSRPKAGDGGRSHSPLRGSPGLTPGSLLPRLPANGLANHRQDRHYI